MHDLCYKKLGNYKKYGNAQQAKQYRNNNIQR